MSVCFSYTKREASTKNRKHVPIAIVKSRRTGGLSTLKVMYVSVDPFFMEFRRVQEKQHQHEIVHFSSNSSFLLRRLLSSPWNNSTTASARITIAFMRMEGIIVPQKHSYIVEIDWEEAKNGQYPILLYLYLLDPQSTIIKGINNETLEETIDWS